jgi:hypothetical protein
MYDGIHNLFGFVVGNEADTLVFIDKYLSDIQSDQLLQIPIQFFNNKIESLFKVD